MSAQAGPVNAEWGYGIDLTLVKRALLCLLNVYIETLRPNDEAPKRMERR